MFQQPGYSFHPRKEKKKKSYKVTSFVPLIDLLMHLCVGNSVVKWACNILWFLSVVSFLLFAELLSCLNVCFWMIFQFQTSDKLCTISFFNALWNEIFSPFLSCKTKCIATWWFKINFSLQSRSWVFHPWV